MMRMIQPMRGISASSWNQPLRSVSCSLRVPTAIYGRKVASENSPATLWLTAPSARLARKQNNAHHQNSERPAQPENTTYLVKHVRIDSPKLIGPPHG